MKKSGWQGAYNVFIIAMEIGLPNALAIVVYHLFRLDKHKTDGPTQLAMFNDFSVPAQQFISKMGTLTGDKEAQVQLTDIFESEFKDMSSMLDKFDDMTRVVHGKNTDEYKLIWGSTRNRFYQGGYDERLAALEGLATEMTTQTVPLGATAVLDYRTLIIQKHQTQANRIDSVGSDRVAIDQLRQILIKKLNKNRGGLIFSFGDLDDCQRRVNSYFPLNLLGDRSVKGHHQLIIPHGDFREVCIHTFLPNDKVELQIGGADVWISTSDNANAGITSGYHGVAGTSLTVLPSVFGDLTKKHIIATNVNLTESCDLIFNIIKG